MLFWGWRGLWLWLWLQMYIYVYICIHIWIGGSGGLGVQMKGENNTDVVNTYKLNRRTRLGKTVNIQRQEQNIQIKRMKEQTNDK